MSKNALDSLVAPIKDIPSNNRKPTKTYNKSCASCGWYIHKISGGYCGNERVPLNGICILPYYPKFYCSDYKYKFGI
jgi:hypothetical protein